MIKKGLRKAGRGPENLMAALACLLAIGMIAGCAAKKMPWGDPQTGLILKYRMDPGQSLKYKNETNANQYMEVMGQSIDVDTERTLTLTMKPKATQGKNLLLGITIDSVSLSINGPQGSINPDMSEIEGKSFDMTINNIGEEIDVSGAEALQYEVEGTERSMSADFQMFFPDFAGKPVKMGETWTSSGTLDIDEGNSQIKINLDSVNTLDGFEVIDGYECVRIKADVTGTMEGEGEAQGMSLVFEGEGEGTDTWYFAYKEGILVKLISEFFLDGNIDATGPANLSIPMKQEMKMTLSLIK
jgi:hypothetical protein